MERSAKKRMGAETHGKHAYMREQINSQVAHDFLLMKESETERKKSTVMGWCQGEKLWFII
jgi:hypothetical protein